VTIHTPPRQTKWRMDGDIRDHAIKLARTTAWYAVRIFEDLEYRFGERDKFPNKRTIERLVKQVRARY
jgi:hypothetical protein